jgi:hypothetical protein
VRSSSQWGRLLASTPATNEISAEGAPADFDHELLVLAFNPIHEDDIILRRLRSPKTRKQHDSEIA